MEQPAIPVKPGDTLADKYRVERVLGQGGMGVVVAAKHLDLDERVAIKFLLGDASKDPEAVGRFLREARAATRIKSEHVGKVLDVGRLESGAPYMVLEFLDGADLDHLLKTRGSLSVAQATGYVLQACEALAEAHARGIIHRDLKPANLFLVQRPDGSDLVKVLDFGISKINAGATAQVSPLTKTSAVMGSPLYMSPEQMASTRQVDARADIWAMGAVLFELLTGRPPFVAETLPELVVQILQEQAPPLSDLRPDAPPEVVAAVARCLEKKPDDRFPSVADFAAAIAPFAPREAQIHAERAARMSESSRPSIVEIAPTQLAPAVVARGFSTSAALAQATPVSPPATVERRGRPTAYIALGVAAAALGLGALTQGIGSRPAPSSPAASREITTSAEEQPAPSATVPPSAPPESPPALSSAPAASSAPLAASVASPPRKSPTKNHKTGTGSPPPPPAPPPPTAKSIADIKDR